MKVTRFDPAGALIVVGGFAWGPRGTRAPLRLVVDTGASETVVVPSLLDELGYSPLQGETRTTIRSAVAEEPGYLIRVARFRALGHEFTNFRVHAHDLPDGYAIDGLLGLNFLRHFDYAVRSTAGQILVERIA